MKRVLVWAAAIALASLGVVLYARDPRDLTAALNFLLLVPLMWLTMRAAAHELPYRVQWALAIALAVAGPIAYLIWPTDLWWFYGALLITPFSALASQREGRLGGDGAGADYFPGPLGGPP